MMFQPPCCAAVAVVVLTDPNTKKSSFNRLEQDNRLRIHAPSPNVCVLSDIEYEVNIKAELEIAHLHEKTDRVYESMLERFARLEKLAASQPAAR